jgi:CheY-like chemotaxis protein
MSTTALIVDDEPGILATLSGVLADQGYAVVTTRSGAEALAIYERRRPDVVFLDIWLPDRDGLETLQALRQMDPAAAVVMMSGHGTAATAVRAIKMGAHDYLEKPLAYAQAVDAAQAAVRQRRELLASGALPPPAFRPLPAEAERRLTPPPPLPILRTAATPQRTIGHSTVVYGMGLHSGGRTGMVVQPLPPDSGIHILSLPTGALIPAHLSAVADTDYATTLGSNGAQVRTVEHLFSALHAYGVTNLLIKVHGEIPVLDGSALDFCHTLEQIGIVDQPAPRRAARWSSTAATTSGAARNACRSSPTTASPSPTCCATRRPSASSTTSSSCATARPTRRRSRRRAPSASCATSR